METYESEIDRIKDLLKSNPRGMSVTDISRELKISRNTTAKYLEMLRISGHVDMESIGTAKVYYLSQRIPVSTLLNFSSDYILVVDSHLNIIQINSRFLELLNRNKKDILWQKADMLLSPLFPTADIAAKLSEGCEGKEIKETMHFSANGKDCYFYAKIIPSTFDNSEQGATLILENVTEKISSHNSLMEHRDRLEVLVQERTKELEESNRFLKKEIADREKAENLLKESEERYKRLYMDSPLGYHIMTKEGIMLEVNPAWLQTMGYTAEEVIGQPFENFLSLKDKYMLVKEVLGKELIDTYHSYCEMIRKDGTTINASFSCNSSHSIKGIDCNIHCIVRDVTSHMQTDKEIEKSESIMRAILNSLPNGILLINVETYEIVYVNDTGCTILGDSKENIIGKKCSDYICHSSTEKCPAKMRDSEAFTANCMLLRSNGKAIPIVKSVIEIELNGKKYYVENFVLESE